MAIVRGLAAGDVPEAAGLVATVWADDPVFVGRAAAIAEGRFAAGLVASDQTGKIVGVAILGSPSRHPHRIVTVDVEESSRRQGVGTALIAELRDHADGAPLLSRLRPWDTASNSFYRSLGFEIAERTLSAVVDPRSADVEAWIEEVASGEASLDSSSDDNARDATATILARWYQRIHFWSPPRPFNKTEARAVFVDETPDDWLVTVSVSGRVVAAGVLQEDTLTGNNALTHLVFAAVDPTPGRDESRTLGVIYAGLFRRAASKDRHVRLEISDNDPAANSVAASLPVDLKPELHIVIEPTTPQHAPKPGPTRT